MGRTLRALCATATTSVVPRVLLVIMQQGEIEVFRKNSLVSMRRNQDVDCCNCILATYLSPRQYIQNESSAL